MRYLGSKRRIGKHILEHLRPHLAGRHYVEPFVGGNMMEKVPHDLPLSRTGYDAHYWTIKALEMIRDRADELPKSNLEFTKEDYERLRADPYASSDHQMGGFALFAYAFGGDFGRSWASGGGRDYVGEAFRNASKQSPKIANVRLDVASYETIAFEGPSVIYCDPPYAGTCGYSGAPDFDHGAFWEWAQDRVGDGHVVFVSEYSAPSWVGDPVWEKEVNMNINASRDAKRKVERLYRVP